MGPMKLKVPAHIKQLKEVNKMGIIIGKVLTKKQAEIYMLNLSGLTQQDIADKIGVAQPTVSGCLLAIEKKGYEIKRKAKVQAHGNR